VCLDVQLQSGCVGVLCVCIDCVCMCVYVCVFVCSGKDVELQDKAHDKALQIGV